MSSEGAAAPVAQEEARTKTKLWHVVAIRLADEGVPVRAISRAFLLTIEEVREVLEGARDRGTILSVPREDWPPGTRRDERSPTTPPLELEDEHITLLAQRTFHITATEARMLIALLRRPALTKNMLHQATARYVGEELATAIKIVDVFVCKMRKKLPPSIAIETQWGTGYFIPPESKIEAYRLLGVKPDFTTINRPAGAEGSTLPVAA
jgi:hypothetical protein